MNHQKVYNAIIEKARAENRIQLSYYKRKKEGFNTPYYENHHIMPKCLGGTNDKENLVLLTAREHYVCHKLLTYIYNNHKGIACAFYRMTVYNRFRKVTSRDYEYAKYIKIHTLISEETRKKMSENSGMKNPKTREKISKKLKGRKLSEETKRKISENNPRIWLGKHMSEESKEKNRKKHLGNKNASGKRSNEFKEKMKVISMGNKNASGKRSPEQIEKIRAATILAMNRTEVKEKLKKSGRPKNNGTI